MPRAQPAAQAERSRRRGTPRSAATDRRRSSSCRRSRRAGSSRRRRAARSRSVAQRLHRDERAEQLRDRPDRAVDALAPEHALPGHHAAVDALLESGAVELEAVAAGAAARIDRPVQPLHVREAAADERHARADARLVDPEVDLVGVVDRGDDEVRAGKQRANVVGSRRRARSPRSRRCASRRRAPRRPPGRPSAGRAEPRCR